MYSRLINGGAFLDAEKVPYLIVSMAVLVDVVWTAPALPVAAMRSEMVEVSNYNVPETAFLKAVAKLKEEELVVTSSKGPLLLLWWMHSWLRTCIKIK